MLTPLTIEVGDVLCSSLMLSHKAIGAASKVKLNTHQLALGKLAQSGPQ